jgi:hypothetical protein
MTQHGSTQRLEPFVRQTCQHQERHTLHSREHVVSVAEHSDLKCQDRQLDSAVEGERAGCIDAAA